MASLEIYNYYRLVKVFFHLYQCKNSLMSLVCFPHLLPDFQVSYNFL